MRRIDAAGEWRLDRHHGLCGQTGEAATPSGSRWDGGPSWHVVATYSQAERRAVANLRHQGYQAYLPLVTVSRRDRVVRSLRHPVEVPMFSGYAFVAFDAEADPWWPIRNTPGVYRLLTDGSGKPSAVARGAVEALRGAEALRAVSLLPNLKCAPGVPCRPRTGHVLEGVDAVVLQVGRDKALVSVLMFGQLCELVVPLDQLEARE
jgi:transcription antitermination factor NusG